MRTARMKLTDLIPTGAQTYSKAPDRYPPGAPRYAERAHGGYVWTLKRDEYTGQTERREMIDCVNGLGAVILGHRDADVDRAVQEQALAGVSFPLATKLEESMARRIVDGLGTPGLDMVRFGKNGCDVTGAAVRIARAATGRETIVYNGYHGHHDWSMSRPPKNGGVPDFWKPISIPQHASHQWDLTITEGHFREHDVAAFVAEPVPSARPYPPPPGYWAELRALCDRHGVLLILDEMVTAFRIGFPGAVTKWGVECDLWCGAKAFANGLPLTALVGRRELMERIDGDVFYSTTHAGEALSLAAGIATWDKMAVKGSPRTLGRVWATEAAAMIEERGLDLELAGYDARPVILGPSRETAALGEAMLEEDMLWQGYINISWGHEPLLREMIDRTERAMDRAAEKLRAANDEEGGEDGERQGG